MYGKKVHYLAFLGFFKLGPGLFAKTFGSVSANAVSLFDNCFFEK